MKLRKRILSLLFVFVMLISTVQVNASEITDTTAENLVAGSIDAQTSNTSEMLTEQELKQNDSEPAEKTQSGQTSETPTDEKKGETSTPNSYLLTVTIEGIGEVIITTDSEKIVAGEKENTYIVQEGVEVPTLLEPDESYYIVYAELNGECVDINDVNAFYTMPSEDAELLVIYDKIEIGRNMLPIPFADQVTYNQTITNSYGNKTSKFQVNGIWAWCCDAHNTTPARGDRIASIVESTNVNLLKVLWYGCLGPGAILENNNDGWMQTGQAASMALGNGRVHSRYEAWYNSVITKPAPPSGFKAYIATPANGKQKLTYFVYTPVVNGYLTATKTSAQPAVTNGNSCYTLNGAEYGVYSNSACTSKVGTLTFNASGKANTLTLQAGTYYLKETKAPAGYSLSSAVTSATVTAGNTTTASVTNRPQLDPIGVLVSKVDADTNQNVAEGAGTLQGAQFTVKYYAGTYSSDPAAQGVAPTRKWVFATDADGFCYFSSAYLISGDAFYTNSSGIPSLPLGTVTIQETKAPEGYLLNPEVYVRQISANGNAENVDTYNYPIIKENSLKLDLVKKQEGTEIVIPGVVFEHTTPNGVVSTYTTDNAGTLTIKGLEHGTHTLREVSAIDGYIVNSNVITFEVSSNNSIKLLSTADKSKGNIDFTVTAAGNISIVVENKLAPYNLVVHKQNNKGTVLEGAEFTLYSEKECINAVSIGVTDANGNLTFNGLVVGTKYYLKETKAPTGYRIPVDENGAPYVTEIYTSSNPTINEFFFYINGDKFNSEATGDYTLTGTTQNREVNVTVINEITYRLPETGSTMTLVLMGLGLALVLYGIFQKRESRSSN